jgi:carbon-monoxide dehydrogenase medium subunit
MKPAAFDYVVPRSVAEAVATLAAFGPEAKVIAGGQSLVPMMNFRLARPEVLVDINRIPGLDHLQAEAGQLRIGTLVRHARLERPACEGPLGALLPLVAHHIAHAPIRTRGTFCGSLAHADPASEWCATALALDAVLVAEGPGGRREIAAGEFFLGMFTTALAPEELLVEARLPLLGPNWRCGFQEFSRRAGDYALAMAVVALRLEEGRVAEARIALGGLGGQPLRAPAAEAALVAGADAAAAADLAAAGIDPQEDPQCSAALRRDLVRAMTQRALDGALAR